MKSTIWIESETFHGNAILNSELAPDEEFDKVYDELSRRLGFN